MFFQCEGNISVFVISVCKTVVCELGALFVARGKQEWRILCSKELPLADMLFRSLCSARCNHNARKWSTRRKCAIWKAKPLLSALLPRTTPPDHCNLHGHYTLSHHIRRRYARSSWTRWRPRDPRRRPLPVLPRNWPARGTLWTRHRRASPGWRRKGNLHCIRCWKLRRFGRRLGRSNAGGGITRMSLATKNSMRTLSGAAVAAATAAEVAAEAVVLRTATCNISHHQRRGWA